MKKINYKLANHIYLNLCILIIAALIISSSDLNNTITANFIGYLGTLFFIIVIFFIESSPILIAIYLAMKYLSKKRIIKTFQLVLFPFFGALIVPFYLEFRGDDHWTTGLAVGLFGIINLILYLANEAYLFGNFKSLKKLK